MLGLRHLHGATCQKLRLNVWKVMSRICPGYFLPEHDVFLHAVWRPVRAIIDTRRLSIIAFVSAGVACWDSEVISEQNNQISSIPSVTGSFTYAEHFHLIIRQASARWPPVMDESRCFSLRTCRPSRTDTKGAGRGGAGCRKASRIIRLLSAPINYEWSAEPSRADGQLLLLVRFAFLLYSLQFLIQRTDLLETVQFRRPSVSLSVSLRYSVSSRLSTVATCQSFATDELSETVRGIDVPYCPMPHSTVSVQFKPIYNSLPETACISTLRLGSSHRKIIFFGFNNCPWLKPWTPATQTRLS